MTDGQGETVDCKVGRVGRIVSNSRGQDAVFVMTSNLASDPIAEYSIANGTSKVWQSAVRSLIVVDAGLASRAAQAVSRASH